MARGSALDAVDGAIGHATERLMVSHHRRRLRKIGWEHALDASGDLWVAGDPPPRQGNAVEVLVDGEPAFAAMAEAIRTARSHVHLTGWHVTPEFALVRGAEPTVLRELLADVAERIPVRVLVWAGAPVPLLRPWRGDVRSMRERLIARTRIQCALDSRERPMHCHHEKTIVVDDRIAFVGGIDLTNFQGDRWDQAHHPPRGNEGWHDVAVRIMGPAVRDIAENFRLRWQAITAEELPGSQPQPTAGTIELQVVRTMPEHMYPARPNGDFRILEAYLRALRSAQRFIYIENQYLWSPQILQVLRAKVADPPTLDFRLLLLLPAKPTRGGDDTRGQLGTLVQADGDNGRLLACTLYAIGGQQDIPVYVHAKVAIVDDHWMTIGSANLNEHSLFNDTEMNIITRDSELVRATRLQLWSAHLGRPMSDLEGEPAAIIDRAWKPVAEAEGERRKRGQRLTSRIIKLPGVSRRSGLMMGPLQGLVVDA
ncbi:MAG TPA: phospholipase D family protein [Candidatus Dormibacteraeota bacterium]